MNRILALALVLLAACSSPSATPGPGSSPPGQPSSPPSDPGGPATPPSDPPPASPPPVTGSVTVTDADGAGGPFQIGAVSRLQFTGSCASAPPGNHTLRFDVRSPSGTVYASVPEDVVVPDSGSATAATALPLSGTTVESLMRAGTWNVTLTLDGGEPLASADVDLTR